MWTVAGWLLLGACALRAADSGQDLFRVHCAPCHGLDGAGGRGPNLAVRKLPRAPDDDALASVISLGIPGTQMPGTRMTAAENRRLVLYIRGLAPAQTAPIQGDRANGERLFWSKANCGQCHTVGPRGGRLGPDLTTIGTARGPDHLRESLLNPEADVPDTFTSYRRVIFMPDNFLQVRVTTRDGRQITGARVNEDTFTIQIRDSSDRIYSFRKDELRELHKDWGKSPMPSYRGVLSDSEIQDIIAYLMSLQGAP
ncbi:MAG: c-type cytochrome [Bryobacteraceae bacterium]|jgi:putative heme-binding domain-containing protein